MDNEHYLYDILSYFRHHITSAIADGDQFPELNSSEDGLWVSQQRTSQDWDIFPLRESGYGVLKHGN